MKAVILSGGLLLVALTPSVYAANKVTCNEIKSQHLGSDGKIYTFTASTECSIDVNAETNAIHTAMMNALHRTGRVENLSGNQFEYVETTPNTGNGDITVRYDASLEDDGNAVTFEAISKGIDASGDTENTKHVKIDFKYSVSANSVVAHIKKTVKIRKPGIAPSGMFTSRVLKAIKKELSTTLATHKNILSGL